MYDPEEFRLARAEARAEIAERQRDEACAELERLREATSTYFANENPMRPHAHASKVRARIAVLRLLGPWLRSKVSGAVAARVEMAFRGDPGQDTLAVSEIARLRAEGLA